MFEGKFSATPLALRETERECKVRKVKKNGKPGHVPQTRAFSSVARGHATNRIPRFVQLSRNFLIVQTVQLSRWFTRPLSVHPCVPRLAMKSSYFSPTSPATTTTTSSTSLRRSRDDESTKITTRLKKRERTNSLQQQSKIFHSGAATNQNKFFSQVCSSLCVCHRTKSIFPFAVISTKSR